MDKNPKNLKRFLLSKKELQLLKKCVGRTLKKVNYNAFKTNLCFNDLNLSVEPEPEMGSTTDGHDEEVMRISILSGSSVSGKTEEYNFVVTDIKIFSSILIIEKTKILEAPSIDYIEGLKNGYELALHSLSIHQTPSKQKEIEEFAQDRFIQQIDRGLIFELENRQRIGIFTDGINYELQYEKPEISEGILDSSVNLAKRL